MKQTRKLYCVPKTIWIILFLSLLSQVIWHSSFSRIEVKRHELSTPPSSQIIRLISLDDNVTAAKMIMLWLQAFDNQPGISIPLKELDYNLVIDWLDLIIELDYKIQYPLLSAVRFYAEVVDEEKQRKMLHYVSKKFLLDPNTRWPFMTHAVYIAKHRIKDMQLALEISRMLRIHARGENVPYWARQMEIFVLEDMGELEAAKIIIGGLLEGGELDDPQQRFFLSNRLKEIEERQLNGAIPDD